MLTPTCTSTIEFQYAGVEMNLSQEMATVIDHLKTSTVLLRLNKTTLLYITTW